MKKLICVAAFAAFVTVGVAAQRGGGAAPPAAAPTGPNYPAWAYAITPPPPPGTARPPAPAEDTSTVHHVAGTTRAFTVAQIADLRGPADWFPEDHPAMPAIVAYGRQPSVRSCSYCHYPNGKGRPSNGGVAGLPVSYIIQTLNDFKNDLRKPGDPRKVNVNQMIAFAKNMTAEEMHAAAEYFAATPWTQWVRVVEAKMIPKTEAEGSIFFKDHAGGMEPIGMRVIETPEDDEQTEPLRNPRSGFVAYVPPGAIKKGEALVTTGGNGKTVACTNCHGMDLRGSGPVPGIAGRSPSYLARQMYDIQVGARHGEWSELMKPVVARLTNEDYVNIVAYVSSRPMPPAPGGKAPQQTATNR
jgi:cytochrome c553